MPIAARVTDMHTCPAHTGGPVLPAGEPTVLIGALPAARVGDLATCAGPPDTILLGEPTVLIGDKPAARLGDPTAHGGLVSAGCATVLIGSSARIDALKAASQAHAPTCKEVSG